MNRFAKSLSFTSASFEPSSYNPVAGARRWIEKMKELKMTHEYVEVAGGDHGSVVTTGAADIFAFFAKHTKASR